MVPCREKSFFLFLFLIFVYFFCLVHPSIPYNGDDWRYLSYARHAWPEAAEWNPARILPEVLLPAIGCMSAFLYKMGIDYISSVSIIYGIFLSFLLTVLAYNFYRLFCDILAGDNLGALLLVSFFMLSSLFSWREPAIIRLPAPSWWLVRASCTLLWSAGCKGLSFCSLLYMSILYSI